MRIATFALNVLEALSVGFARTPAHEGHRMYTCAALMRVFPDYAQSGRSQSASTSGLSPSLQLHPNRALCDILQWMWHFLFDIFPSCPGNVLDPRAHTSTHIYTLAIQSSSTRNQTAITYARSAQTQQVFRACSTFQTRARARFHRLVIKSLR